MNAGVTFGFTTTGNSRTSNTSSGYMFDQQIVITQPVQFSLQLNAARPSKEYFQGAGGQNAVLPIPAISFSGGGVLDSISAPYGIPPLSVTPASVTQTFTGTLEPGTYSFDSSWTMPQLVFTPASADQSEAESVSATLVVAPVVPEPAAVGIAIFSCGLLSIQSRTKRNFA